MLIHYYKYHCIVKIFLENFYDSFTQKNLEVNTMLYKFNEIRTFQTDDEIDKCVDMVKNSEIELILQPKMNDDKVCVSSEFCESVMDKFLKKYKYVRLIPQTHKFLNIR